MTPFPRPVMGLCAWPGTGKTTLLTRLLPRLRLWGLRVAVIKHAHERFDLDQPGKDSYVIRQAGACQMLIASRQRMALTTERSAAAEPTLADSLTLLDPRTVDLVLVEGFKREPFPKIELHRPSLGLPLLCGEIPHIVAVASDDPHLHLPRELPLLDLAAIDGIARFILDQLEIDPRGALP